MPAESGAGNTAGSTGGQDTDENTQSLTPAQLREGVKLNPGPDKTVIHVTGVEGRPRTPSK